jgi:hypothetical protein
MSNILEIVSRALDENNWHYERIEEKGAIHFTTLARNGVMRFFSVPTTSGCNWS